jgi:hypothetical protein
MVAPGAWKRPAGVVPAVCGGLGLLVGVSGAGVAAAGGQAAAVWSGWCRLRPALGWGAAG